MSAVWHNDPNLKNRFHPDYPDDIQVLVHDGGPRIAKHPPELMWVRVVGKPGEAYESILLNTPHQLETAKQGDRILFLAPPNAKFPIRVTGKYLAERAAWTIVPCDKCGFAELFDAPSDLIRRIFPNVPADAVLEKFTSFCPLCGGVQVISSKGAKTDQRQSVTRTTKRKWWQFWKP